MKRIRTTQLLIFLSCSLLTFSFTACSVTGAGIHVGSGGPRVKGGPPPHAPAHGYRAKHAYYYYPDAYVYFDTERNLYFYLEGDKWMTSVSLPYSFRARLGEHVAIEIASDKPYTHFASHRKKYPPGQLKKQKNRGKKKW